MTHIFFVPGMFGTMIEYVLTTFSKHEEVEVPIRHDGSMHNFRKQWHPNTYSQLQDWPQSGFSSPIYPWKELHLPEIIANFRDHYASWNQDKKILIHAPDLTWCEINLLFQYHKMSLGLDLGLNIFLGSDKSILKKWNPCAESWEDLKTWQWREWFSIFYPNFVREWIQSPQHVDPTWLCITNRDILQNSEKCLTHIAAYCGIEFVKSIHDFCQRYVRHQQYVMEEYDTIDKIINAVLCERPMSWQPLSIVSEAILQQKLRQHGYELRCDDLDIFPCNNVQLEKLLYKPEKDLHA